MNTPATFDPKPPDFRAAYKQRLANAIASRYEAPSCVLRSSDLLGIDYKSGPMHLTLDMGPKDPLSFDFHYNYNEEKGEEKETETYSLRHGKLLYDKPLCGRARKDSNVLLKASGVTVFTPSAQMCSALKKEADIAFKRYFPCTGDRGDNNGSEDSPKQLRCAQDDTLEDIVLCAQTALTHRHARDLEFSGLPMPIITSVGFKGPDEEATAEKGIFLNSPLSKCLPPNNRFSLSIAFKGEELQKNMIDFRYDEVRRLYRTLIGDGEMNTRELQLMRGFLNLYKPRHSAGYLSFNRSRARPLHVFSFASKSGVETASPKVNSVVQIEGKRRWRHVVDNSGIKTTINGVQVVMSMSCHRCKRRRTYCHFCHIKESHRVKTHHKKKLFVYIHMFCYFYFAVLFTVLGDILRHRSFARGQWVSSMH